MTLLKTAGALLAAVVATTAVNAETTGAVSYYDAHTGKFVTAPPGSLAARQRVNPVPRQVVDYDGPHKKGTIIVNTDERRLYYVLGDGKAIKYGIGVGRPGFTWAGTHAITRKAEWPGWTPPPAMRKRLPNLPYYLPGGPDNPLGARAMYIGSTIYRIHGTAEPWTIGQAVSSGCIRMTNEDIADLYEKVGVGTRVIVMRATDKSS